MQNPEPNEEVVSLLKTYNILQLLDVLLANGFDDRLSLQEIEPEDLEEMQIAKLGEKKKLLRMVRDLNKQEKKQQEEEIKTEKKKKNPPKPHKKSLKKRCTTCHRWQARGHKKVCDAHPELWFERNHHSLADCPTNYVVGHPDEGQKLKAQLRVKRKRESVERAAHQKRTKTEKKIKKQIQQQMLWVNELSEAQQASFLANTINEIMNEDPEHFQGEDGKQRATQLAFSKLTELDLRIIERRDDVNRIRANPKLLAELVHRRYEEYEALAKENNWTGMQQYWTYLKARGINIGEDITKISKELLNSSLPHLENVNVVPVATAVQVGVTGEGTDVPPCGPPPTLIPSQ
eukprot:CAMPEP_0174264800 /NCGR_PEP_ID=MMETSP0439-20130205/24010_1 /TAXON_ID=0 /ORGANISM="Stereomyxa ramosa, Strain Chinc5" /LENGTH=346 /DNA_ID=CAMNT_0015350895 /DNA_START=53 /DNA_END=1093 /DNA_ORIENTATION=-